MLKWKWIDSERHNSYFYAMPHFWVFFVSVIATLLAVVCIGAPIDILAYEGEFTSGYIIAPLTLALSLAFHYLLPRLHYLHGLQRGNEREAIEKYANLPPELKKDLPPLKEMREIVKVNPRITNDRMQSLQKAYNEHLWAIDRTLPVVPSPLEIKADELHQQVDDRVTALKQIAQEYQALDTKR